jgi:hypothetical protein
MAMTLSPRAALINIGALGVATSVTLVVLYVLCAVVAMALPNIALSHVADSFHDGPNRLNVGPH